MTHAPSDRSTPPPPQTPQTPQPPRKPQEPQPPLFSGHIPGDTERIVRRLPPWWYAASLTCLAAFVIITALILEPSPLIDLDAWLYSHYFVPRASPLFFPVSALVFFGQRTSVTVLALVYTWRRCRDEDDYGPLVLLAIAWVASNGLVALIKVATGRLGPRFTSQAYTIFVGGNIFPSGHTTGAVVMYGMMAMVAAQHNRRWMVATAVVLSITVGMGTVGLNTHWFSDVIGAWFLGGLVLLGTWALAPGASRLAAWLRATYVSRL